MCQEPPEPSEPPDPPVKFSVSELAEFEEKHLLSESSSLSRTVMVTVVLLAELAAVDRGLAWPIIPSINSLTWSSNSGWNSSGDGGCSIQGSLRVRDGLVLRSNDAPLQSIQMGSLGYQSASG